jgi:hypothetical protein
MPPDPTSRDIAAAGVLQLLGAGVDGTAQPTPEMLRRAPRKVLLECAQRLQIAGVSKLGKDELAARIETALVELDSPNGHGISNGAARTASAAIEPVSARAPENGSASARTFPTKFDLGPDAEVASMPKNIPWGYGVDRVTAMPVDPFRLYVYWEVTDEAVAAARSGLGTAGDRAWLNLRVYDITGRLFDGTNAHSYFDHKLERHDRQWFFEINKPTSAACVEVGLRSEEGYFVKIARSGRVDFPRHEPVHGGPVEWLSVRAGDEMGGPTIVGSGGGTGSAGRDDGAGTGPAGGHASTNGASDAPRAGDSRTEFAGFPVPGGHRVFGRTWEWQQSTGTEWSAAVTRSEWTGPLFRSEWEAGPFTFPIEVPSAVELRDTGEMAVRTEHGRTHIVYGPWQVVIRGIGARAQRQVLGTWEFRRQVAVTGGLEKTWSNENGAAAPGGSSEIAMRGASERSWLGASELMGRGGSELWMIGASELRLRGASETLFQGASEHRFRGASERTWGGASEWRLGGATERSFAGASERVLGGASERGYGGASERVLGGASERRAGVAGPSAPVDGAAEPGPSGPSLYPQRDSD